MKTLIVFVVGIACCLALPSGFVLEDPELEVEGHGAEEPFPEVAKHMVHGNAKTESATANPEMLAGSPNLPQPEEIPSTSPLSVLGANRATGIKTGARSPAGKRQGVSPQIAVEEPKPEVVAEEPVVAAAPQAPTGRKPIKMPLLSPRAQPNTGVDDSGSTKPAVVRKSDADLHEFLKRRRQERILATTEADPLTLLKTKDETADTPAADGSKAAANGRSFGSSRRGSSRKAETTTTTTTSKPVPSKNAAGSSSRFGSSGTGRKNSRGSTTTEAPVVDKPESTSNGETFPKARFTPKRLTAKNN